MQFPLHFPLAVTIVCVTTTTVGLGQVLADPGPRAVPPRIISPRTHRAVASEKQIAASKPVKREPVRLTICVAREVGQEVGEFLIHVPGGMQVKVLRDPKSDRDEFGTPQALKVEVVVNRGFQEALGPFIDLTLLQFDASEIEAIFEAAMSPEDLKAAHSAKKKERQATRPEAHYKFRQHRKYIRCWSGSSLGSIAKDRADGPVVVSPTRGYR